MSSDELLKFVQSLSARLAGHVCLVKLGAEVVGRAVDVEGPTESLDARDIDLLLILGVRSILELLVHLGTPVSSHRLVVERREGRHQVLAVLRDSVERRRPQIKGLLVLGDQVHHLL
jgi:hypothetical protein